MKAHQLPRIQRRYRLRLILAITVTVISGCTRVAVKPPGALPVLPPLITKGAAHYTIEPGESNVRFLVYRAGPLAAFGHNHVIRAAVVHGDVYLNSNFSLSGFQFTLPVGGFRVDEPAERKAEGADFAEQPSPEAIYGTTHNMLGAGVLDAERYPDISVRSAAVNGSLSNADVTIRITLHGVQRDIDVPITLAVSNKQLIVEGHFHIKQSNFGIAPFSILGGGLQVSNVVKVHFRIVAVQS